MHESALSPDLLAMLRFQMRQEALTEYSLGGGTSLSLRFGHRQSVDLDWFISDAFNSAQLQETLRAWYPDLQVVNRTIGSLSCVANGIKLDFLRHAYPRLQGDNVAENLRMISLPDLAAMKINAVTNRGSKKDFSDLLLLHESGGIPLARALDFFCAKYGEAGRALALRSLVWFDDAEEEPDPIYLNGWTWDIVRQTMDIIGKRLCQEAGL